MLAGKPFPSGPRCAIPDPRPASPIRRERRRAESISASDRKRDHEGVTLTGLRARRRTALAGSVAGALAAASLLVPAATQAATGCQVTYQIGGQWPGGFTANIAITNLGDAVAGWTLGWSFTAGQAVTQAWGFTASPA